MTCFILQSSKLVPPFITQIRADSFSKLIPITGEFDFITLSSGSVLKELSIFRTGPENRQLLLAEFIFRTDPENRQLLLAEFIFRTGSVILSRHFGLNKNQKKRYCLQSKKCVTKF